MDDAQNVVFIGGPGTGKTIWRPPSASRPSNVRAACGSFNRGTGECAGAGEKHAGKAGQIAYRLMYVDLVVLDELGYLPFSQAGGALLFHLISKLYERTSVIITTNLSFPGVGQCIRGREDDDGAAGSPDASLPYR